ncbi:MAG: histidinol-phosphatase [Treponema sp.]|nr:histidinol-phosphatase [Treponema sp.]
MNQNFSSLHTHTVFCDGRDDVETMCRAAFAKGLASLGFSAHAPVDNTGLESCWHMKAGRLGEYIEQVSAARRRWEGKITIYLGLEVDYVKGLRSPLDRDIQELGLDYLIGSVHYLVPPRGAPFTVDAPAEEYKKGLSEGYGGDAGAMLDAYWDAVAEMASLGGFDIAGHLDLYKKNTGALPNPESANAERRAEEIARALSSGGIAAEVNTGAMNRGFLSETYPSPAILRLLRLHNVPAVVSADAHEAKDLDGHYREARQALLSAGYAEHVLFEGRSGGKPVWSARPL